MSAFKLYLNFGGTCDLPEHTYIHKSKPNSTETVQQVADCFCTAYNKKFHQALSAEQVQLLTDNDKTLDADRLLTKATPSGSDVTVLICNATQHSPSANYGQSPHTVAILAGRAAVQGSSQELHARSPRKTKAQEDVEAGVDTGNEVSRHLKPACQANPQKCSPVIKQFLERAREAESKKYFRAACKIYEQVQQHCKHFYNSQ